MTQQPRDLLAALNEILAQEDNQAELLLPIRLKQLNDPGDYWIRTHDPELERWKIRRLETMGGSANSSARINNTIQFSLQVPVSFGLNLTTWAVSFPEGTPIFHADPYFPIHTLEFEIKNPRIMILDGQEWKLYLSPIYQLSATGRFHYNVITKFEPVSKKTPYGNLYVTLDPEVIVDSDPPVIDPTDPPGGDFIKFSHGRREYCVVRKPGG